MRSPLPLSLFLIVAAACGDDGGTPLVDAGPDAPPIDGPAVCGAPSMMCGTSCLDVSADELNCGSCGNECAGGEACNANACACPPSFVPATLAASQFDQIMDVGGGITIGFNPNLGDGINPIIVGFNGTTAVDTDIDLATVTIGTAPFVAAGYGFDLSTQNIDATFLATAGTLHLDDMCATRIAGTLTNATFEGINGGFMDPMVDPDGCTFTVATLTFEVGSATPCP